jgi:photosystem II stability/assembly factor-like uncharacterized protein
MFAAVLLVGGALGCGSKSGGSGGGSSGGTGSGPGSSLVDASRPPFIVGFAVNPGDGSFVLATNKGLFEISKEGGRARDLRAAVKDGPRNGAFGKEVSSLAFGGPDKLYGSGHPDQSAGQLPAFLGLITSTDGGRTWQTISRAGLSDLHVMLVDGQRVVAYDTTLGAAIVSDNDGKDFTERSSPRALVLDMAMDPANPKSFLASTADALYASPDEGATWKKIGAATTARLSWTPKRLARAVASGEVATSANGGKTWTPAGRLPRPPGKLVEGSDGTLYAALENGAIMTSPDGGKTWKDVFTP